MILKMTVAYFPYIFFSFNPPFCTVTKKDRLACLNTTLLTAHVRIVSPWILGFRLYKTRALTIGASSPCLAYPALMVAPRRPLLLVESKCLDRGYCSHHPRRRGSSGSNKMTRVRYWGHCTRHETASIRSHPDSESAVVKAGHIAKNRRVKKCSLSH